jgi:hypothetical protein
MTTIELAQLNPSARRTMHGYERLAGLMANDKGLSIFRSFKKLNAKNLLYLQAEIVNVQTELEGIIEADETSQDEDREKFSTSVCFLKEGIESGSEQWAKVLELRELLDKYSESAYMHITMHDPLRLLQQEEPTRLESTLSQKYHCSDRTLHWAYQLTPPRHSCRHRSPAIRPNPTPQTPARHRPRRLQDLAIAECILQHDCRVQSVVWRRGGQRRGERARSGDALRTV